MDCSLPGSSIHGIFQARVPEWGAIAFFAKWAQLGFISSDTYKLLWLHLYLMKEMNETAVTCHLARLWQKWDLNLQLLISRPVHSARGHRGLMGPSHSFFPLLLMFAMRSGNQRPVKISLWCMSHLLVLISIQWTVNLSDYTKEIK